MSQPNYSVQRTFINFDMIADEVEVPRKRSSTWDGTMSCGSCSDHEEADNCSTSSGSAGDAPLSDGTVCDSIVEVDSEDQKDSNEATSVPPVQTRFDDTMLPQSVVPFHGEVPMGELRNCTWLDNPGSSETVYCILPPITVRAADMQYQSNQFVPAPFNFEGLPFEPTPRDANFKMGAPQWPADGEKEMGTPTAGRAKIGSWADAVEESTHEYGNGSAHPPFVAATGSVFSGRDKDARWDERTTLMLRNLPNEYTRAMLLQLLDSEGFFGMYDFVYLPVDFQSWKGLGYAFVNLVSHADAEYARAHFDGFNAWVVRSVKVCKVSWGEPLQGLVAHCERYRNSPVMHESVPEYVKPAVFFNGQRRSFPTPTMQIQPPRAKLNPRRAPLHAVPR